MLNINPYDADQFHADFVETDLYQRLSADFTVLDFEKYSDIYRQITPRQFLGDSTISVFSVVPFYYLQPLLNHAPSKIYDLGCGWNVFKRYIPMIQGVGAEDPNGHWFYADEYGFVDDIYMRQHAAAFESVFSINALHFVPIHDMMDQLRGFCSMIKPGGRGFITLNIQRMLDRTSEQDLVKMFGTTRPGSTVCDSYIRQQIQDLPVQWLILDVDFTRSLNDVINGNIRLVFQRP